MVGPIPASSVAKTSQNNNITCTFVDIIMPLLQRTNYRAQADLRLCCSHPTKADFTKSFGYNVGAVRPPASGI